MTIQNYVHDGSTLTAGASIQGAAVPALTKRIIRAATVTNSTAAPLGFSAYLVPQGGVPDETNIVIANRTIAVGESYSCPEMVNQGLNPGGSVQALGNGLTFKYTGTDFA